MANGRLTLLQIVQKTLEALNLDEVNSISDSPDAEQVAQIAQDAYYELLNQSDWPHTIRLGQLESLGDATKPNYLRIPDEVVRIDFIKYDATLTDADDNPVDLIEIKDVKWLAPVEFLRLTQTRNTEVDGVETITDFNGVRYHIYNDRGPAFWTSFDDKYVVFDSFNSDVESTLQGNKSQAMMKWLEDVVINDNTMITAPSHFFQTWLAETKSTAFIYIKQEASAKDEQRARRGLAVLRRAASRTDQDDGKVKYGRPVRRL
jgi:hypothetical protein